MLTTTATTLTPAIAPALAALLVLAAAIVVVRGSPIADQPTPRSADDWDTTLDVAAPHPTAALPAIAETRHTRAQRHRTDLAAAIASMTAVERDGMGTAPPHQLGQTERSAPPFDPTDAGPPTDAE